MTVELPEELAARVRRAAEKAGVTPEDLTVRLLAGSLAEDPMQRELWNGMTVERWVRESREWITSRSTGAPLQDDAYSRESMYEDERL